MYPGSYSQVFLSSFFSNFKIQTLKTSAMSGYFQILVNQLYTCGSKPLRRAHYSYLFLFSPRCSGSSEFHRDLGHLTQSQLEWAQREEWSSHRYIHITPKLYLLPEAEKVRNSTFFFPRWYLSELGWQTPVAWGSAQVELRLEDLVLYCSCLNSFSEASPGEVLYR